MIHDISLYFPLLPVYLKRKIAWPPKGKFLSKRGVKEISCAIFSPHSVDAIYKKKHIIPH
jgi:hypothetical protein